MNMVILLIFAFPTEAEAAAIKIESRNPQEVTGTKNGRNY
jgi:hypothetical protein